jgi:DNA-binding protein H-NS
MSEPVETVPTEGPTTSLPAIVSELREIELRKAELEAQVIEAKKTALTGIVEVIRKYITDNGYEVSELAGLLAPGQKGKAKGKAKAAGTKGSGTGSVTTYALNADPSKTYSKGPVPTWMKEAMVAAGMDPAMGLDRTNFKASHMTVATPAAAE